MWKLVFLVATVSWAGAQGFPTSELVAWRQSHHFTVPTWDPGLADSARARAEVLVQGGRLSHHDAQGRGPGLQLLALGYPQGEYGEVLGAGANPAAVWSAWLASRTHREVLDEPGWLRWGVGSATAGDTTVWVVRFWKP